MLSVFNVIIISLLFRFDDTVICSDDGKMFLFSSCGLHALFMMAHNFTTMQTAAVVRGVFIKSVKSHKPEELVHVKADENGKKIEMKDKTKDDEAGSKGEK